MTALDWLLLLIVGTSALLGLLRGLIGVAVSLLAWLLAGVAAWLFGGDVGRSLVGDGQPGWGEYLGGYALSFAAVWIVVALVGLVLRRLAHSAGLSGADRLFGLGLGAVRGVFFACVLLLLLGLTGIPAKPAWRESAGVAVLLPAAKWLRGALPPWMAQRVDLDGRGTSLQAEVAARAQGLQDALPVALPASIPETLPEAMPMLLPRAIPEAAPQQDARAIDQKRVSPDPQRDGTPPDDKRVH